MQPPSSQGVVVPQFAAELPTLAEAGPWVRGEFVAELRSELGNACSEATAAADARDAERFGRAAGRLERVVAGLGGSGADNGWVAFEACKSLEGHGQLRVVNLAWRLLKQLAAACPAAANAALHLSACRVSERWDALIPMLESAPEVADQQTATDEWQRLLTFSTFHGQNFVKLLAYSCHASIVEAWLALPAQRLEAALECACSVNMEVELRREALRTLAGVLRHQLQQQDPRVGLELLFASGTKFGLLRVAAAFLAARSALLSRASASTEVAIGVTLLVDVALESLAEQENWYRTRGLATIVDCLASIAPPQLLRWALHRRPELRCVAITALALAPSHIQKHFVASFVRIGLCIASQKGSGMSGTQRRSLSALAVLLAAAAPPLSTEGATRAAMELVHVQPCVDHFAAFCRSASGSEALRKALAVWASSFEVAESPVDAAAIVGVLPPGALERAEVVRRLKELLGKSTKGSDLRWPALYTLYALLAACRDAPLRAEGQQGIRTLGRYAAKLVPKPLAPEICCAIASDPSPLRQPGMAEIVALLQAALVEQQGGAPSTAQASWVQQVAAGWAVSRLTSTETDSTHRDVSAASAGPTCASSIVAVSEMISIFGKEEGAKVSNHVQSPVALGLLLGRARDALGGLAARSRASSQAVLSNQLRNLYRQRTALDDEAEGDVDESRRPKLRRERLAVLIELLGVLEACLEIWAGSETASSLATLTEEAEVAFGSVLIDCCLEEASVPRRMDDDSALILWGDLDASLRMIEEALRFEISVTSEFQPRCPRSSDQGAASMSHDAEIAVALASPAPFAGESSASVQPPSTRRSEFRTVAEMVGQAPAAKRTAAAAIDDLAQRMVKGRHSDGGGCTSAAASRNDKVTRIWSDEWLAAAEPELLDRLVPVLESTISQPEGPDRVRREDIAGLQRAKESIWEMLILPRRCPELFRCSLTKPPRGVLLFGPPGTGKTMLARWIASEAGATFFNVSGSTVFSKWMGEAEKTVRVLFLLAQKRAPSVIFLDEVDALLSARGDKDSEGSRRVKNELLQALDGLASGGDDLLVVGATNLPWELDAAAARRFAKKLHVPLPGDEARREHISRCTAKHHSEWGLGEEGLDTPTLDWLVGRLDGFSMSDIKELLREAALIPAREAYRMFQTGAELNACRRRLLKRDFEEALTQVFPGINEAEASKFEMWNAKYGAVRGADAMRDEAPSKAQAAGVAFECASRHLGA